MEWTPGKCHRRTRFSTLDVKLEWMDGDEDFWSENVNHAFALGEGEIGSLEIS